MVYTTCTGTIQVKSIEMCTWLHWHDLQVGIIVNVVQEVKTLTWYSRASNPLKTNSNKVFKFSGLGEVTKILEYLKKTQGVFEKHANFFFKKCIKNK